jgi:hypothetical protein
MNRLDTLITQKPALGYVGSGISLFLGWVADTANAAAQHAANAAQYIPVALSWGAGAFGLLAGYYTFRLQRRAWKKAQDEDARPNPKP